MLPFLGRGNTSDWVHSLGQAFWCSILLHRVIKASIMCSPPCFKSSAGMLSILGVLPGLSLLIALATSSFSIVGVSLCLGPGFGKI